MNVKKYDLILMILIFVDLMLCVYNGFSKNNNPLCTSGSDCSLVQNSVYGSLFGIKLAWFGVICFLILYLLFFISRIRKDLYWMFFLASLIGAGFAIYFISLQVFILGRICTDCLLIDSIMLVMFSIIAVEFMGYRKEISKVIHEVEDIEAKVFK